MSNIKLQTSSYNMGKTWREVDGQYWSNLEHLLRALKNNNLIVYKIQDARGVIIIVGDQDES